MHYTHTLLNQTHDLDVTKLGGLLYIQCSSPNMRASLAFKRYLDIAVLIEKPVVIVTDNDENIKINIQEKNKDYQQSFFTYYYEQDENLDTIEPSVLAVNLDKDGQPTETFRKAISSNNSMMKRDKYGVLNYMSGSANKSEWAYRVFGATVTIKYPEYIENVIKHFEQQS